MEAEIGGIVGLVFPSRAKTQANSILIAITYYLSLSICRCYALGLVVIRTLARSL
jgi:hypothetical protein